MRLREVFPEHRKVTHPYNKDKKITYSNSSLKVQIERKYGIVFNTREKLQEMFCVFCDTDTNHSPNLAQQRC